MNKNIEILTTDDSARWMQALERMHEFDFHHLPSYHRLAEMRSEGQAVLLDFRNGDREILFPMLIRDIDGPLAQPGLEQCADVTSVHGYVGPLVSHPDIPTHTLRQFTDALLDFFASRNVVTAFTRLHPLFAQSEILQNLGEITEIGVTVSVDLTMPPDEQYASYRKSHRYEIERLRRNGFTCTEVGKEHLDDFVRIYTQAMLDLGAGEFYLYDRSYFEFLMDEMPETIHLFICCCEGEVTCAALFAECKGIIQYHLAGTDARYRKLAPMKLILDTVRNWGNETGARTLHLGGGVGAQRDKLYEFKMGFGSREHTYAAWRYVANKELYEDLCSQAGLGSSSESDDNYFPPYRNPTLQFGEARTKEPV